MSLFPHSRFFPVFGRASGVLSLEKSDSATKVRHGIEKTVVLNPDDVYRNLVDASNKPPAETYPRPLYVSSLSDAYVTHQGGYLTRDSRLIEEFSHYFDQPIQDHRYLHSFRLLKKIKKIERPVIALAGMGQYNYHHWWMDIMPKLHLIQTYSEVPPDPLYYVETTKPFQMETLGYLGIQPVSLLNSRENQIIQARHLIAASPRSATQKPEPWVVAWLRKTFSCFGEAHADKPQCVVLSRKRAKNRGIINEDEIMHCLAPLHPTLVEMENLTVAQQIGLFAGAKWVVAPHGAGLTNMLFAPTDCRIIELFGSTKINDCYRYLAESVGCPHTFLLGADVIDPQTGEKSIRADIAALKIAVFG